MIHYAGGRELPGQGAEEVAIVGAVMGEIAHYEAAVGTPPLGGGAGCVGGIIQSTAPAAAPPGYGSGWSGAPPPTSAPAAGAASGHDTTGELAWWFPAELRGKLIGKALAL